MGNRAAQHFRPQQAIESEVSRVLRLARDLAEAFDSGKRFSYGAVSQVSPPMRFSILDFGFSIVGAPERSCFERNPDIPPSNPKSAIEI
jgi:hypothetical protein